jgi:predicted Zn-dependent peptidase
MMQSTRCLLYGVVIGLQVMIDIAARLDIQESEVERERGVILSEMRDNDGFQVRTLHATLKALLPGLTSHHSILVLSDSWLGLWCV